MRVIEAIARAAHALKSCKDQGLAEAAITWIEVLSRIEREHLPSGGGFDSGTRIDDTIDDGVVRFTTSFHHMDENGVYDGWTTHIVAVRPSFVVDLDIYILGPDRNDIHDYIDDVFRNALTQELREDCTFKACMERAK